MKAEASGQGLPASECGWKLQTGPQTCTCLLCRFLKFSLSLFPSSLREAFLPHSLFPLAPSSLSKGRGGGRLFPIHSSHLLALHTRLFTGAIDPDLTTAANIRQRPSSDVKCDRIGRQQTTRPTSQFLIAIRICITHTHTHLLSPTQMLHQPLPLAPSPSLSCFLVLIHAHTHNPSHRGPALHLRTPPTFGLLPTCTMLLYPWRMDECCVRRDAVAKQTPDCARTASILPAPTGQSRPCSSPRTERQPFSAVSNSGQARCCARRIYLAGAPKQARRTFSCRCCGSLPPRHLSVPYHKIGRH